MIQLVKRSISGDADAFLELMEKNSLAMYKVAGLCNNANQLARVANTCGEASQQSIDEMTGIAREVWEAVKAGW